MVTVDEDCDACRDGRAQACASNWIISQVRKNDFQIWIFLIMLLLQDGSCWARKFLSLQRFIEAWMIKESRELSWPDWENTNADCLLWKKLPSQRIMKRKLLRPAEMTEAWKMIPPVSWPDLWRTPMQTRYYGRSCRVLEYERSPLR